MLSVDECVKILQDKGISARNLGDFTLEISVINNGPQFISGFDIIPIQFTARNKFKDERELLNVTLYKIYSHGIDKGITDAREQMKNALGI